MTDRVDQMITNLEQTTGHPLDWWISEVTRTGLAKHGEMVAFLKTEHGLGHGYANLVVHSARQRAEPTVTEGELVDAQYTGKEHLRPIYDAIIAIAEGLGPDVEIAPKKASVSLRRSKQFALITPATKTRIDLGLNLEGEAPGDRLQPSKGMCTHKVALTETSHIDDEVRDWLHQAYRRA